MLFTLALTLVFALALVDSLRPYSQRFLLLSRNRRNPFQDGLIGEDETTAGSNQQYGETIQRERERERERGDDDGTVNSTASSSSASFTRSVGGSSSWGGGGGSRGGGGVWGNNSRWGASYANSPHHREGGGSVRGSVSGGTSSGSGSGGSISGSGGYPLQQGGDNDCERDVFVRINVLQLFDRHSPHKNRVDTIADEAITVRPHR